LFILLIGFFITYNVISNEKDSVKFKQEYERYNGMKYEDNNIQKKYHNVTIPKNNHIIYLNNENIVSSLQGKNKIIYFGSADSNSCRLAIEPLLSATLDNGLEEVYYYNPNNLIKEYKKGNKTAEKTYKSIINVLENNLGKDNQDLNKPILLVVSKKKVIAYHEGLLETHKSSDQKLNKKEYNELLKIYEDIILELIMCTDNC